MSLFTKVLLLLSLIFSGLLGYWVYMVLSDPNLTHNQPAAKTAESAPKKENAVPAASNLSQGKEIYDRFCALCHGGDGKGQGAASQALNPKPVDFTQGKFRHLQKDQDEIAHIVDVINNGISGTAMVSFQKQLPTKEEQEAVAHYIVNFAK